MDWYTLNFTSIDLSFVLISSSGFFLATPTILYGFFPKQAARDTDAGSVITRFPLADSDVQPVLPETAMGKAVFYFKDGEIEELVIRLEAFMRGKLPFLNSEYSIHDLSNDIDVPVYQLSPVINQHFNSNFKTWINRYRVNHFIAIHNLPESKKLTLDALARDSGFSNRTTFTNAFKKEKNQTPGVFLKLIEQPNSIPSI